MMKAPTLHPGEEQLLRYLDGELSQTDAVEVRSHLDACWDCRLEVEELQKTIASCVRYRRVLQARLPEPPHQWPDIYRKFAEVDETLSRPSIFARAWDQLWNVRQWTAVAAALALVCVLTVQLVETPSAQAAELLQKAVLVKKTSPVRAGGIRIRTRKHTLIRSAALNRKIYETLDPEVLTSILALFRSAQYNWESPLDAAAYKSWHDQLTNPRDEVKETPGAYRIETKPQSSELTSATLVLRRPDLQPVQERFEFKNQDWMEITAVDEPVPTLPEAAHSNLPRPSAVVKRAATDEELNVLAALHRIGADLGDPIQVTRQPDGEVLVSGIGIPLGRQQEVRDALAQLPNVAVRFSDSSPARLDSAAAASPSEPVRSDAQTRVISQVGGRAAFDQIGGQALDLSEPLMSRVYALHRLAERFPVDAEAALPPAEREKLARLRQEHLAALRTQLASLEQVLAPVTGKIRPPANTAEPASWQANAEELFQSARRLDKLIAVTFGASPATTSSSDLPAQLSSSLGNLRTLLQTN